MEKIRKSAMRSEDKWEEIKDWALHLSQTRPDWTLSVAELVAKIVEIDFSEDRGRFPFPSSLTQNERFDGEES
jgi:hypothetical protein